MRQKKYPVKLSYISLALKRPTTITEFRKCSTLNRGYDLATLFERKRLMADFQPPRFLTLLFHLLRKTSQLRDST